MDITKTINLRKALHKYPELSGSESKTANTVKKFVEINKPAAILENLGGHGLAVIYEYSISGPTIAIRCELDALPIVEENLFGHRSINHGVSHKCGHDGHMSIVASLSTWLTDQDFAKGKVVLLFQPAEETGKGAEQVMNDIRFKELDIDYLFALHNIPGEAKHTIISMREGFSAEVQSFSILLKGVESHAAEPEHGINPAVAISKIISECSKLNISDPHKEDFAVLTPVHANMGQQSYGISPASGELHYTIRTWSTEKMNVLKTKLEEIFRNTCEEEKLAYKVNWFEYFPASKNDQHCNDIVLEAAKKKNMMIKNRPYPFKFGEDFGWFSRQYKTAMFGLGAGIDTPALHNANYDFPDDILETGIEIFKSIIVQVLDPK